MEVARRYPHMMRIRYLENIPTRDRISFLNSCVPQVYEREQNILLQNQPANGLYLVAHGLIEVTYADAAGQRTIICHLGQGESIGEIETISELPCVATCTALRGAVTLFCPHDTFMDYMQQRPFLRNFAGAVRDKLNRDNALKAAGQHRSPEEVLCATLCQLSDSQQRVEVSQAYLSDLLGVTRQTVNKMLGKLRDEGIIDIHKGGVTIRDSELLQSRSGGNLEPGKEIA